MSTFNIIAEHESCVEVEVYFTQFVDEGICNPCKGMGVRPASEVTAYILKGEYPCPACGGTGVSRKRLPDKRVRCFLPKKLID